MLRFLIILLSYSILWASIPAGYYDAADGKTGIALQQALHDIIDNHTVISYSSLWTYFQTTDDKANGKVWDIYSDNPSGSPPYEFTFVDDQCGSYANEGDCYNREHSWPKSWFDSATPMYTDLFHIIPTDGKVNGMRSNYPYGEVSNPTWTSQNGSKLGPNTSSGYSGTVFEPIDAYKGDLARNYFYMSTRYYGEDSGWTGSDMTNGSQLESWALDLLMSWHDDDAVSQKELDRNEAVYGIQGNRNPFIDHPEYVAQIWGSVPNAPTNLASSNVGETSLTLSWTDNASDENGYYVYNNTSPIDTLPASTITTNISGLSAGTSYTFKVSCYNDAGESSKASHTVSTTGLSGSVEIYISEVSEGTATATEFLELYNAGSSAVDISNYKIIRVTASNNASEFVFDIGSDGTAGDLNIPAKGLWVLSRGADRSTFESGFSSFPTAAKFYQGTSDLYYASGTARRWRLRGSDGTVDTDDGTLIDDTDDAAGGSDKRTVQSSGNTFTTSSSSSGANSTPGELDNDQSLPVELSAWSTESLRGQVVLNWTTESELENQGFIVERRNAKAEDRAMLQIASFATNAALIGHGSTTARNTYSFTDQHVAVGQTYTYQLSDVDYSGKLTKYAEISVTVKAAAEDLKPTDLVLQAAYPNPFNPEVTVAFTLMGEALRTASLQVFDMNGRFVTSLYAGITKPGTYTVTWDGGTVTSGIYFIRLSSGNDVQFQRVTLLK